MLDISLFYLKSLFIGKKDTCFGKVLFLSSVTIVRDPQTSGAASEGRQKWNEGDDFKMRSRQELALAINGCEVGLLYKKKTYMNKCCGMC